MKYCPYCGVQNAEGNNFCVGCSRAIGDKSYPIENSTFGSNSTPKKNTSGLMGGIIAIVLIVSIVLFATTYVYLSGTVSEYDGYSNVDNEYNEEQEYDDELFVWYVQEMFGLITNNMAERLNAGLSEDWDSHKFWAEMEKDAYEITLIGIYNDIELSSYYANVREVLRFSLENYSLAMDYYMKGDVENGGYYENIGTDYLEEVIEKLDLDA